jgi:serine/threonine-protein kinase
MFLDEARLGAQLDHSNIVQTLELGEQNGRYYMVMEYLAGMSLAQLARRTQERVSGGYMPVDLVLGLAAQTCAGLTYAHRKAHAGGKQLNLVHRDISPQNLVVSFDGVLKIVDFGIAKADMRDTHTRSGTIKGKFAYMSPEQCLAEPIDRRTDVFALGTVVHELLSARRLFKRSNTYETYQAILKGNVPPPSRYNQAVDPELDMVVRKALAYHKEDRYESAEALGEAMLRWLHRRGTSVSASDVARYVESVCGPEIQEHAEHMRELISGRTGTITGTDHLRWDTEDKEGSLEPLPHDIEGLGPRAAAAASDYDEPTDTILEPDPAEPVPGEPAEGWALAGGDQPGMENAPEDAPTKALGPNPSFSPPRPSHITPHPSREHQTPAPQRIVPLPPDHQTPAPAGAGPGAPPPGPMSGTPPPGMPHTALPGLAQAPSLSVYDSSPPGMVPAPGGPPWSEPPRMARGPAPGPGSDLRMAPAPMAPVAGLPPLRLAIAFVIAAGIGIGITVLIGSLIS